MLVQLKRFLPSISTLENLAHTAKQNSIARAERQGASEMMLGLSKLVLPKVGRSKTVPRVEVPPIGPNGRLKERNRPIELFHADGLVARERRGIRASRIELGCSAEATKGLVMLLLQGEGVSDSDPGFRREAVNREEFLSEVGKGDRIVEVPEEG